MVTRREKNKGRSQIKRCSINISSITNDIAILKLATDVQFNDNVVPACLPTNPSLTYANQDAIVSGIMRNVFFEKKGNKSKYSHIINMYSIK